MESYSGVVLGILDYIEEMRVEHSTYVFYNKMSEAVGWGEVKL